MPNHIVPQKYLNGWTDNNSCLVTYRKDVDKTIYTPPKKTGAENNFYSDSLEKELNRNYEIPTIPVLDKLRAYKPINNNDKHLLSKYIVNMLVRVPYSKERIRKVIPSIRNSILWDTARTITARTGKKLTDIQPQLRRLRVALESEDQIPSIFEYLMGAERLKISSSGLNLMNWQFLTFQSAPAFITSDNPVFYFSDIGIGNEDSELVFPISANIALWATWQQKSVPQFCPVNEDIVTEINRRTAFAATRFIYFPTEEDWVKEMIKEATLTLRRIIMTNEGHHKLVLR